MGGEVRTAIQWSDTYQGLDATIGTAAPGA